MEIITFLKLHAELHLVGSCGTFNHHGAWAHVGDVFGGMKPQLCAIRHDGVHKAGYIFHRILAECHNQAITQSVAIAVDKIRVRTIRNDLGMIAGSIVGAIQNLAQGSGDGLLCCSGAGQGDVAAVSAYIGCGGEALRRRRKNSAPAARPRRITEEGSGMT